MNSSDTAPLEASASGKRPRDYVDRTVGRATEFVSHVLFTERWAAREGLLQRLDPRVKVIGAGVLILGATLAHRLPVVWSLPALALALAAASRIPPSAFAKRVWLSVPLFTGLVLVPATLNLITPGPPVLVLGRLTIDSIGPLDLPPIISVTRPGLDAALLVLGRVGASVSAVVLLAMTTRWADLLAALRALRVSSIFILVVEMAHRYAFILISIVEKTHLAKRSRTIKRAGTKWERAWVGSRAGALIQRSRVLTESVYQAMLSRGYDGEPRTIRIMRMGGRDALAGAASLLVFITILGVDRWVAS